MTEGDGLVEASTYTAELDSCASKGGQGLSSVMTAYLSADRGLSSGTSVSQRGFPGSTIPSHSPAREMGAHTSR